MSLAPSQFRNTNLSDLRDTRYSDFGGRRGNDDLIDPDERNSTFEMGSSQQAKTRDELGSPLIPGDYGRGGGEKYPSQDLETSRHSVRSITVSQNKGFRLSWDIPSIRVPQPGGGDREIMHNVTGFANPGRVVAMMGPSGSGKTTLLSTLANRLDPSCQLSDDAEILYGGRPWHRALKQRIGLVEQDDITFPELTVRQALMFTARLRMSGTNAERSQRVESLIRKLRIERAADSLIGGGLKKGISGGERKRVCIAAELITEPFLLFCDEPTSGLDSETALIIIRALRELGLAKGMSILCSIHQPNSLVFNEFDDLCFMVAGRCTYLGKCSDAKDYFAGILKSPCPENFNPPDWFMEQAVSGQLDGIQMEVQIPDDFHNSEENFAFIDEDVGFAVPFSSQFSVIFARSWGKIKADKLTLPFWIQLIAQAILTGVLYVGLGDNESDIESRAAYCFQLTVMTTFVPLMDNLSIFMNDYLTLRKELLVNSYSLPAYYAAKVAAGIPSIVIFSALNCTVTYTMGFYQYGSVKQFVILLGLFFLSSIISAAIGIMIGAAVQNPSFLLTTGIIFIIFSFNFAGFYVPIDGLHPSMRWIPYIDVSAYYFFSFYRAIITFGIDFTCDHNSNYASCNDGSDKITPDDILTYDNDEIPMITAFYVLGTVYAICLALGFLFLRLKASPWIS